MSGCRIVACEQVAVASYDGGSHGEIDLCAPHTPNDDPLVFRLSADSSKGDDRG